MVGRLDSHEFILTRVLRIAIPDLLVFVLHLVNGSKNSSSTYCESPSASPFSAYILGGLTFLDAETRVRREDGRHPISLIGHVWERLGGLVFDNTLIFSNALHIFLPHLSSLSEALYKIFKAVWPIRKHQGRPWYFLADRSSPQSQESALRTADPAQPEST
jgi:hypothetical protein